MTGALAAVLAGGFAWLRAGAVVCAAPWDRAGVATPAITKAVRTGSKRNKDVFIPIRPLQGLSVHILTRPGKFNICPAPKPQKLRKFNDLDLISQAVTKL